MKILDPDSGRMVGVQWTTDLEAELQQLHTGWHCRHERKQICQVECRDGRTQWRRQCLDCFELIGGALKPPSNGAEIGEHIQSRLSEQREAHRDAVLLKHYRKQRAEYAAYLESDAWMALRDKVLMRDNFQCLACGDADATEVHHLTYARIFAEPMFDLVSVCGACHFRLHEW